MRQLQHTPSDPVNHLWFKDHSLELTASK